MCVGIFLELGIASDNFAIISEGSGLAKKIISCGNTSVIPPTFVETTSSPADAASFIFKQNLKKKFSFKNTDSCMKIN